MLVCNRLALVVGVVGVGVALLGAPANAGFLDLFTWDLGSSLNADPSSEANRREDALSSLTKRTCNCEGNGCNCCVDFNMTFIDLGGPGCVRMNYISPSEGILVNVSYGDSQLHSETVKGANPEPTCMDVLTDLAQMCARFSDLAPTSDGLRWCLQLEPTLLGLAQTQYQVGCFRMGPLGMTVDPPVVANATLATAPTPLPGAKPETGVGSEAALIAAVNESAEEGIAFFSNLLGLNFGGAGNQTQEEDDEDDDDYVPAASSTTPVPVPVAVEQKEEAQRSGRGRFAVPPTSVNRVV